MARIRSIHPGLWTDEAFMSLGMAGRLMLLGLWTEAFDDGIFDWKPLTLKAKIFPVDSVDVGELLTELICAGVIARVDDHPKRPGIIRNFQRYQRPKKPNSSGMFTDRWSEFAGKSSTSVASDDEGSEVVPNSPGTDGEKSALMEEGGGKRDDEGEKRPPHSEPSDGARDLFDEIFKTFPRNPQSSEGDAYRAFKALGSAEQGSILAAAQRYAKWFGEDCARRKRSEDVGRDFVPKFSTWLTNGAWREAGALPLNADAKATVIATVRVDRTLDAELFAEIERLRGKKAPSSPWAFPAEVVEQAKQALKAKAAA